MQLGHTLTLPTHMRPVVRMSTKLLHACIVCQSTGMATMANKIHYMLLDSKCTEASFFAKFDRLVAVTTHFDA